MSRIAFVFGLAAVAAMARPAAAQSLVDFEEFAFTYPNPAPSPLVSKGVTFTATPNALLSIYRCIECGYPYANRTLAMNTIPFGAFPPAVLTASFSTPVPSVSVVVSDTERSVTLKAYDASNSVVFQSSYFTSTDPVNRTLAVSSPSGIARIEVVDDGGDGCVLDNFTFPIAPCQLLSDLIARVQSAGFANGIEQSLMAKLQAAQAKVCDGDPSNDGQASGVLGAFQNQLKAQSGKTVTAGLAQSLSDQAQVLIDTVSAH